MPPGLAVKVAGGEAARGVGVAQTFPNPNGVGSGMQRDFQAAMKAAYPKTEAYTAFHLEGYLAARVLTRGLQGADTTIDGSSIAAALKAAGPMDFGGFRVSFDKGNAGSAWVDIGVIGAAGRLLY